MDLNAAVSLGLAEHTVAEARMRVVGADGRAWLPAAAHPAGLAAPDNGGEPSVADGTLVEVAGRRPLPAGPGGRAALPGGVPAGRGPGAGRGDRHGEVLRVAAVAVHAGLLAATGQAVFEVDGDRLRLVGPHGYQRGAEQPVPGRCRWTPTTRPPRWPAPAGRCTCRRREAYRRPVPGVLAARSNRWAARPGLSCRWWPRADDGRVAGVVPRPGGVQPDERSVLTTIARMLAQALSRAASPGVGTRAADGLQRTMMPTHSARRSPG